jgi:phage anti-repressor protein
MHPLVSIAARPIGGIQQQTVNARELWQFVESKRQFANWIQNRIVEFGFAEGEDFNLNKFVKVGFEGDRQVERPVIEYYLTLNMAKELAMVEKNAKGREVRRYFINCERLAKEAHAANQARQDQAFSPRMQRHLQPRPLPRLDRYQNGVVNRKAASMARQMADTNRDYLLHRLSGLLDAGDGRAAAANDQTLAYLISQVSVEEAFAFGHARDRARDLALIEAYRRPLG